MVVELAKRITLSRLDVAAIGFAIMLSLTSLAKGAVYDTMIAILLLLMLPVLLLALSGARPVHATLCRIGVSFLLGIMLVLLLQPLMAGNLLQDNAAWMEGVGRLLLLVMTFSIALLIGTSESSARLFLQGLLVCGIACLAFTFFVTTWEGVPTTTKESYTHGFVNPNNAAAYIGIMLLMTLAQSLRFFRFTLRPLRKIFLDIIDDMSITVIIRGGFLLFSLLVTLAGLFMTGSRGGILLTLLCAAMLCFIVVFKMNVESYRRKIFVAGTCLTIVAVMVWIFFNFGQVITSKLTTDGVSSNSRFDIMAAVLPMIAIRPLLGTGLNSFPGAFQHYRPLNVSTDGIIDKAHNSYLEFAAEMGLPALLMLLAVMGWMGLQLYRGFHARKERYVVPALGLSVWLFVALYSLIDFPLQIPGIAALVTAIITVCVSQTDREFSEPSQSTSRVSSRMRIRKRHRSSKKK